LTDSESTTNPNPCTIASWPSSRRLTGPKHYEVAINLNNLAALKHAKRNFAEALPLYQRALAIKEKLLGTEHPDVATTLNNLAVLLTAMGKREEAAQLYARALAICERTLEPTHPKVAGCHRNLERCRSVSLRTRRG